MMESTLYDDNNDESPLVYYSYSKLSLVIVLGVNGP